MASALARQPHHLLFQRFPTPAPQLTTIYNSGPKELRAPLLASEDSRQVCNTLRHIQANTKRTIHPYFYTDLNSTLFPKSSQIVCVSVCVFTCVCMFICAHAYMQILMLELGLGKQRTVERGSQTQSSSNGTIANPAGPKAVLGSCGCVNLPPGPLVSAAQLWLTHSTLGHLHTKEDWSCKCQASFLEPSAPTSDWT